MAEHKIGEMDIEAQEKTFVGFMNWTKWAVITIIAVLVLMGIFLTF